MQRLNRIPEERRMVAPFPLRKLLLLSVLVRCLSTGCNIPPLVLNPQVYRHEDA